MEHKVQGASAVKESVVDGEEVEQDWIPRDHHGRTIFDPEYQSECSKCDGSMGDGNCDIANLQDVE